MQRPRNAVGGMHPCDSTNLATKPPPPCYPRKIAARISYSTSNGHTRCWSACLDNYATNSSPMAVKRTSSACVRSSPAKRKHVHNRRSAPNLDSRKAPSNKRCFDCVSVIKSCFEPRSRTPSQPSVMLIRNFVISPGRCDRRLLDSRVTSPGRICCKVQPARPVPAPHIQCSRCAAKLSRELAEGLCPACLLDAGIGQPDESSSSTPARPNETAIAVVPSQFPQTFGDYELLGEIARGGQGVVYRARHAKLQREVALKMFPLHPWTSPADLERFRTEARVAADLDHPAIVPIFDIGDVQGQHFFTMKLVDGVGLDRLSSNDLLPPSRSAEIVGEAARAIHHAHERGVLHRDVKPGNILLDSAGHPHITDFGLAKLLESDNTLTRTRDVLGTPSYISPEVAAGGGRKLSTATDVYGLGTVLYHLLTGQPPFAGGTTLETIRQVLETDPRRPRLW